MAEAQHAAYIVIDGPGHEGTRLALREGITSFGRLPANDVILLGDLVSRHHSRITFFEARATLQDLGSHNGSWVNGERVTSKVLNHGDAVRVGNFKILFHQGPIPARLDETTAGEETSGARSAAAGPAVEASEGVDELLREVEAARAGQPSPARAVHFLYRTTDALARAADPAGYADLLLELVLEHVQADGAAWLSLRERELELRAARGPSHPLERFDPFVPALEWAIDRHIALRSDDVGADVRFGSGPAGLSVICAPLEETAFRGALYVQRRGLAFQPSDLHRLAVVAHLMKDGLQTLSERAAPADISARVLSTRARAQLSLATPGRPRVERTDAGVAVWLELHGLAPTAPHLDPEQSLDLIARFQALVRSASERWGGFSIGLNGHAALVLFEHPREGPRAAFELALEARTDIDTLLDTRPALGPRRVRAGIASGPLTMGAFDEVVAGFAAFGPGTSQARRLTDAAGAGRVLVDEETLSRAGSGWSTRKVGSQPARRGHPAQTIYELSGRSS